MDVLHRRLARAPIAHEPAAILFVPPPSIAPRQLTTYPVGEAAEMAFELAFREVRPRRLSPPLPAHGRAQRPCDAEAIEARVEALATATDSARWTLFHSFLNDGGIVNDLVTIFETPDVALLAMAKAALDEAGIRYVTENEFTQDLFGLGRVGGGYNLVTGPPRIRVVPENAERAREILAELDG